MKRKWFALWLAAAMVMSMTACAGSTVKSPEPRPASAEIGSVSNESSLPAAETPDNDLHADRILTKDQMLSDYDSMWAAMKESYPFFGVLARSNPEEPDYGAGVIENYRGQIENMTETGDVSMCEFILIIANSLYDVCGSVGHVGIINSDYYRALDVNKRYVNEMPELQAWIDVYDQPEAGKTAYIKVKSFDDTQMEKDLPEIRAFLEEVRDYDNLIIDLQENGGGNASYWEEAFVRPNISEAVTSPLFRMMKDTELAKRFYGSSYESSAVSAEDVKLNPAMARLPREDMEGLTLAKEITTTIEPEFEEALFQGKIWVLTGPQMYSSSEAFAVFCKGTGFATLVGQTTGGSNSGGAILYELPVSHLLIQFDVEYCLNADGSCNMEMGTTPDVESEQPLKTTLDLIKGSL